MHAPCGFDGSLEPEWKKLSNASEVEDSRRAVAVSSRIDRIIKSFAPPAIEAEKLLFFLSFRAIKALHTRSCG
jgi:hypothetical protein